MKSNNTIEINGHLYDANSGLPLDANGDSKKITKLVKKTSAKFVDGFGPQKKITVKQADKTKPLPQKKVLAEVAKVEKSAANRAPAHSLKMSLKRSSTLNRRAVKQPALKSEAAKPAAKKLESTALKGAVASRLERAKQVQKSQNIARFHKISNHPASVAISSSLSKLNNSLPAIKSDVSPAQAKAAPKESTKEYLIKKALESAPTTPAKQLSKKSLKNLSEHHHHFLRYASTAFVILVLAGYVAYLNVPDFSMKVAARRAGFAANMPEYKPSGYSLNGPIAYSAGQVTVNYKANTDSRKFSLQQQPTTWDSTALLENFVTKKTANYLTYQDSGLTIYIYDGSSAAWVNGGKFYKLEGKNSLLDTDQLLKLATSV
jgi:hypothetical protein